MVRQTDLRIGNWIDMEGKGFVQILSGNDIDDIQGYRPILITEELLLSLGFIRHGKSEIFEIKQNNFAYHLGVRRVAIFHPGNTLWHWLGSHIDHVHQIQNLFYCIVGYDLTFNGKQR